MKYFIPLIFTLFSCAKEKELDVLIEIKYGQHERHVMDFKYVSRTCYLFIHGGAWATGDKSDWFKMDKIVCGQGYSYAAMNYRFSNETDWRGIDEDAGLAIKCIKSLGIERVVLCGMSAGSTIALVHATHGDVDGVITWGAISDNRVDVCNWLYKKGSKYGYISIRDSSFNVPIIAAHGMKDNVTYPSQSVALKKNGAIFVPYYEYGHGLTESELYDVFDNLIR